MTDHQFSTLSADLRMLAGQIPLHWGNIQNNKTDDQIDMFGIESYAELTKALSPLPVDQQNYLLRRWYLWKCAQCDEYLFYVNANVQRNPDPCDKAYDIVIDGNIYFDVKGTVIPQSMRGDAESVIKDPRQMIDFFYDHQSTGRRYDIQNRLFIVHHSFVDTARELFLRCAWQSKRTIYNTFCTNAKNIQFYHTHGVNAGVVFILERQKGVAEGVIYGM